MESRLRSRIAIINGEPNSATAMYRCESAKKCFKLLGFDVEIYGVESIEFGRLCLFNICYCVRVPASSLMLSCFDDLKVNHVKIVSDFDDLVFDASYVDFINGVNYLSEGDRIIFLENINKYENMIRVSDFVVVTTLPLANAALKYNKNVNIIKNYPLSEALFLGSFFDTPKHNSNSLTIGYYSGTMTHQADFAKCSSPLFDFLDKNSLVRLRIVGKLNINEFSNVDCVSSKIDILGYKPYKEMLIDLAGCDFVIAPLETGNLFCECKSELKFIEAAIMGVPIVASPTQPFSSIITNKVNGFLADSSEEWLRSFEYLLSNRSMIKDVGVSARRYLLSFYGKAAQLNDYRNLINLIH